MTEIEFYEWWAHHINHFPGIETWFSKLPDDEAAARDADVTVNQTTLLNAWRDTLAPVALDAAKNASDEMHADSQLQVAYERHPAKIVEVSRKHLPPATRTAWTRHMTPEEHEHGRQRIRDILSMLKDQGTQHGKTDSNGSEWQPKPFETLDSVNQRIDDHRANGSAVSGTEWTGD